MSAALSLLKSFGRDSKPYKGFGKLPYGNHEIERFRLVSNKMYKPTCEKSYKTILLVELKNEVLFLPSYFAADFQYEGAKKLHEINSDGIKKFLFYGGIRSNRYEKQMCKFFSIFLF